MASEFPFKEVANLPEQETTSPMVQWPNGLEFLLRNLLRFFDLVFEIPLDAENNARHQHRGSN